MNPLPLITALLILLAAFPSTGAEENLGRLFFTPERRAALDRQRQQNSTLNSEALSEDQLTLSGVVRRSSGRHTAWINGSPINDPAGQPADPAAGRLKPGSPPLRVGDTLNQASGEKEDLLKGGSLSIRRSGGRAQP